MAGCLEQYPHAPISPFEERAVLFVRSLVNPSTGMVASRTNECFTTVYKSSLAAMVFIHQGDHAAAEGIFDRFEKHALPYILGQSPIPFQGFPKDWDACTGLPTNTNYWEGDNAFLLLALNYYYVTSNHSDKYNDLRTLLVNWLVTRSQFCDGIVAEGVANMYAALLPFGADPSISEAVTRLGTCYTKSVAYSQVLDHTVRGALIFKDMTGFDFLDNFRRDETWVYNNTPVRAYSAFSGDSFINVEISAQLLLTSILTDRTVRVPTLQTELEKLWLAENGGRAAGLPYFVENLGFDDSATLAIIDPTAYLLFSYWKFNPFTSVSQ